MAAAAGIGFLLPTAVLIQCRSDAYQPVFFQPKDMELLHAVGETILPKTPGSPGARETNVAHFIDLYVKECYAPDNRVLLQNGLKELHEQHRFTRLNAAEQLAVLEQLDAAAKARSEPHYFRFLKNLVLFGYFTSEGGATQSLRHVPVPGKYDGDFPFEPGDKAWSLG